MLVFAHAGLTLGITLGLQSFGRKLTQQTPRGAGATDRGISKILALIEKKTVLMAGAARPQDFRQWPDFQSCDFIFIGNHPGWSLPVEETAKCMDSPLSLSSTALHLILDKMWSSPDTPFWPVFGWRFGGINLGEWLPNVLQSLFPQPVHFTSRKYWEQSF